MRDPQTLVRRYNKIALAMSLVWLGGLGSLVSLVFSRKSLKLIAQHEPQRLYGKTMAYAATGLALTGLVVWGLIVVLALFNQL